MRRLLSYVLVWSSFYEQLAWAPVLVLLATAAGDPAVVAVAASAYSLANLIGNLGFGLLTDRTGRYRVAGAGLLTMAGTTLLHLVAATPAQLVGMRFLHGLAAATVAPAALASVTDGAPGNRRGEAMARVGLVIAVASMVAPPITGRMARGLGVTVALGALAAGLLLVGLVTLAAGAPAETRTFRARSAEAGAGGEAERFEPLLAVLAGVAAFAIMFGQNVLFYALPLRGSEMGMDSAAIGGVLSTFAVGALIAFLPPLSRLSDRWGRRAPLVAGLALTTGALLALARADGAAGMRASLFFYGLGFGLAFPAVTALGADAAGKSRRGLAFGVLTAAFSAGAIVGPLAASGLSPAVPPFVTAAAVAFLGAVITGGAWRQARAGASAPPVGPGA